MRVGRRFFFRHVEHVVHGHDAQEPPAAVPHGQHRPVVFAEKRHGAFLTVGGGEGDERIVHQIADLGLQRPGQKFTDAQVVDELAVVVHDVEHVERLAVPAAGPHVFEDMLDGPVGIDGDEIGRHQPADAAFGVAEEILRDGAFGRRERGDEALDGLGWEFLQERRAVVGRHLVEDRHGLFAAHGVQEFLLLIGVEVLEHVCSEGLRDHTEDDDLVAFGQIGDHIGEISRCPLGEKFAQTAEVAFFDEALDLGLKEFAEHGDGAE